MEAREYDYVIVGGGLAAVAAVDGIREVDGEGTIVVLTEEAEPPYQRPPLSKEYLQYAEAPRELLHIKPAGWFEEQEGIRLERRQRALALDAADLRVTTARGNEYRGRRLLLATGGRPRRLEVPGASLPGVMTLRQVEDSEALRVVAASAETRRAVLIGAGFIGMELAASLHRHGVAAVVVEAEDRVWPRVLPPELAAWMQERFEERGVQFRLGSVADAFLGDERLRAAVVEGEEVSCEVAVVGVGMVPNDGVATDAGLAVQDGIQVDAFGETSHAGIYAAGDVARFPDPVFGGASRVEHWEHAREHGRLVGRNMAGASEPYTHLSYFFSEVFGLKLNVVGRPAEADQLVFRGSPGEGPFVAFGVREGRLHAAVMIDAPRALEPCRALVRWRADVSPIAELLSDPTQSLEELAGRAEDGSKARPMEDA